MGIYYPLSSLTGGDVMRTFIASFHQENHIDSMQVQKLTASEFIEAGASGFRRLFELEKNVGSFVFFDQKWRRTPFPSHPSIS